MPIGPKPDNPPRRYYGWTMLAVACLTTVATSPGQTFIVGSLFSPFFELSTEEGGLGLSKTAVTFAYLLATAAAAIPLTLVGKASDRFGPRRVILILSIALALTCAYMGFVRGFATMLLGFFLLRFIGQGSLGVVSGHTVALWFEKRLGTVEAIRHGSMSAAVILLPLPIAALLGAYGWRWTFPMLGVLVAVLTLPAVLLIFRNTPEDAGQVLDQHHHKKPTAQAKDNPKLDAEPDPDADLDSDPDTPDDMQEVADSVDIASAPIPPSDPGFTLRQAVGTTALWAIAGVGVLNGLVGTAIIFHMQGLIEGAELFAGDEAPKQILTMTAAVMAPWAIVSGVMSPIGGVLVDRVRPRYLLAASPPLLALAVLLVLIGHWAGVGQLFYVGMGLFGLSQAAAIAAGGPTIARWFGRRHHGSIRGFTSALGVAGTACGPIILGLSFDYAGGFSPGMLLFVVAAIPLTITVWSIDKPTPPGGMDDEASPNAEPNGDPDAQADLGPELIDESARIRAVDEARARTKGQGGPPVRYELADPGESIPLVGLDPDEASSEPDLAAESGPEPEVDPASHAQPEPAGDDDPIDLVGDPPDDPDDNPDSRPDRLS